MWYLITLVALVHAKLKYSYEGIKDTYSESLHIYPFSKDYAMLKFDFNYELSYTE